MITLVLNPLDTTPATSIEFGKYPRIPLSITFGEPTSFQGTIYCENVYGDDGVEFRFYDQDKTMFGFAVTGYEKQSVKTIPDSQMPHPDKSPCYAAFLFEGAGTTYNSRKPVDIYKSDKSILVVIDKPILAGVRYYRVCDHLYAGVNESGTLMTMLLNELHSDNITDSFGA